MLLLSGLQSGQASSWIGGGVLAVATALLVKHQLTMITVVEFVADGGCTRMDLDERLAPAEIRELNRRLAQELDWPVVE